MNHGKGVIPAPIFIGINSSRNPEKQWIPNQVQDDKLDKTYEVTYKRRTGQEVGSIR
jgi:hypothetical protein